jgi:hypothetical protein
MYTSGLRRKLNMNLSAGVQRPGIYTNLLPELSTCSNVEKASTYIQVHNVNIVPYNYPLSLPELFFRQICKKLNTQYLIRIEA